MALPSSGAIDTDMVLAELGRSGPLIIPDDADVRQLVGIPTGQIILPDDFWGASSVIQQVYVGAYFSSGDEARGYRIDPATGSLTPAISAQGLIRGNYYILSDGYSSQYGYVKLSALAYDGYTTCTVKNITKGTELVHTLISSNATEATFRGPRNAFGSSGITTHWQNGTLEITFA